MSSSSAAKKCLSLSLSGGGHLLPYYLGVCHTLLTQSTTPSCVPHTIAGSSAGAIAATAATLLPPQSIRDYADRFIQDRGRALHHLREVISEHHLPNVARDTEKNHTPRPTPRLLICTTRCRDGRLCLHEWNTSRNGHDTFELLEWVRASCTIPASFHPMDVLSRRGSLSYPETDGIFIQGEYHVDGGIAGPAPPTLLESDDCSNNSHYRVVVSPISGSAADENHEFRISPATAGGSLFPEWTCRGNFRVQPSLENLKALRVASGATSSHELQSWWDRGQENAATFCDMWKQLA